MVAPLTKLASAFLTLGSGQHDLQSWRRAPLARKASPVSGISLTAASTSLSRELSSGAYVEKGPWDAPPRSAYVHIPFCRRRCYYCDFPIKVVGDRPEAAVASSEAYADLLLREIECTAEESGQLARERVQAAGGLTSVFFGGGTPSLMPPPMIDKVVGALKARYGLAADVEIAMEMDPGTFDKERLRQFLDCGVTRVSVGVQAFDATLLKACGRAHSLEDVHKAIETLQREGVVNYSIDLMSGLPDQTMAQWEASLAAAIASGAAHVSVYDLQVEAGTAFGKWYSPGSGPLPNEETSAAMYAKASQTLRAAGFDHYEVSNYAKPGYQCRHNRVYWEGEPFFGFGMGAASYLGWHRFTRPRSLTEYEAWVQTYESCGGGLAEAAGYSDQDAEEGRRRDRLEDLLMVGLRLKEGIDVEGLAAQVGLSSLTERLSSAVRGALRPFVEEGLIVNDGRRVRLVDPEGFLVSNEVMAAAFAAVSEVKGL